MAETFNFDGFQIPHVGVQETETVRTDANTVITRPLSSKISNFGSLNVGGRLSNDYTMINLGFKAKDELSDWSKITEDTGVGQDVSLFGVSVNHNPYVAGSTVKFTRDDQFIRMSMSKDNGAQVDGPRFDVMDSDSSTADGIIASTNGSMKNWPSEGWRSFGGKYDFLPYSGGTLK